MRLALAGSENLEVILGLIEDARDWLYTKDTDQWASPWPGERSRNERVLKGLRRGATWIVWDGDTPASTVTLTSRRNPNVWSKPAATCDLAERAVYVDRLITRRKYAGSGLGGQLMDWAGLRGRSQYGAKWIRIDVWRTNRALHDYYFSRGFKPCGTCPDPDYPSGALFQKPVSMISEPRMALFWEEPAISREGVPLAGEDEMLGIVLDGRQFRMISLQADGTVRFLDSRNQSHAFLYVAELAAYGWKSAVDELEALINSAGVSESQLQSFFEWNPNFLCGDIYEEARPHIVLQRPEVGDLIPDFALKPYNQHAFCDLLELKRPSAKLVVGQDNRRRLSAAVMEAVAQLREYRDYFELPRNRNTIEEAYGLRFFRPRMMVVIGKRSEYSPYDLRKAESDIPYLTITTYDDLVERARFRMRQVNRK